MCQCGNCDEVTLFSGSDGVGIVSTTDNGDGTFTILMSDGTTWTSSDLTGPPGPQGPAGVGEVRARILPLQRTPGANTYTVGADVYTIQVELIGGGGASAFLADQVYAGGGGGAYVRHIFSVTPGQVINYIIGTAGLFSGAGLLKNGGATIFNGITAGGGFAPTITPGSPNIITPGWGGVATSGNFFINGEKGQIVFTELGGLKTALGGGTHLSSAGPANEDPKGYPQDTTANQLLFSGNPVVLMTTDVGRGMGLRGNGSYTGLGANSGGVLITEYYIN